MPPDEYQNLINTMNSGFAGIHARIDTFKDEFNSHRLACQTLFAQIGYDEAIRKGEEKGIASSLKNRINWGTVKTGISLAIGTLLTIAAVKILVTNFDKVKW